MDNKIKLFAVASVVAVITSGCTGYNNQDSSGSSGYSSGSSQSSGSGQVANNRQTCVPCATKPRQTYTYKPRTVVKPKPRTTYRAPAKPRTTYRAPAKPKGQHNQQYYLDRWNRQQNQNRTRTVNTTRNTTRNTNYGSGYYTPPNTASSTTYYDYSSAAQNKNTGSLVTSNKSIYTGQYQKRTYKPYKPTTYAGGSSSYKAVTYKPATYAASSGGSSYTVKKGDTVFEIMRQTGVYWKDIIRLNNLKAPYNINPGQRIRLK